MSAYAPLLAALIALLVGLTIGKAWERYKLRDGKWIDRRRARESPHSLLGLNCFVANQIDLAIEELSRAASLDGDALEVHMILGNLYREKGQVGKAITVHQNLMQRPKLSKLEHAYVLLCLGLDYKRGGFVDRAHEAFNEVLRLDSQNEYALLNLQKLHEEQHQWTEAYDTRRRLSKLAASGHAKEALDLLFAALVQNPHALSIHQAIWRALGQLHHPGALVDRYRELTEHAVFYLDPHVCVRCRYRSTELLWQCPHCHDWHTFVEERIAPAQDTTEVEV